MSERKKSKRTCIIGMIAAALLLGIDQATKYLAIVFLSEKPGVTVIPGVFQLYYLENRGAAFGMLSGRQIFFVAVAILIVSAAVYVYWKAPAVSHYTFLRLICVLVVSGAAGNMLDRILYNCVIDFLYISLIDFPVFNVADCYVCIGAALAVAALFTVYRDDDFYFLSPSCRHTSEETDDR